MAILECWYQLEPEEPGIWCLHCWNWQVNSYSVSLLKHLKLIWCDVCLFIHKIGSNIKLQQNALFKFWCQTIINDDQKLDTHSNPESVHFIVYRGTSCIIFEQASSTNFQRMKFEITLMLTCCGLSLIQIEVLHPCFMVEL